ncbi:hypothetical protein ACOSQ4_021102 [Xanthoceras sorbifolium]
MDKTCFTRVIYWLAREVKLKQPRSLREAMRMAEIIKGSYNDREPFEENSGSKYSKPLQTGTSWEDKIEVGSDSKGKTREVKRLSREELQEHIKNGLCFKYGEKWAKGH